MAIQWGSWQYAGGNGMRVGLDVTRTTPNTNSTGVVFTIRVYTQNQYSYSDSQALNYAGNISGSTSFTNSQGAGTSTLRATLTHNYTYPGGSYGTSPGTRTFTATLSGAYNGITPTVTVTSTIPARPYDVPNAITDVTGVRNSATQNTISWNRQNTAKAPYSSITVLRSTYTGSSWSSYSARATLSGGANSYSDATSADENRVYRYIIRANNSVGSADSAPETVYHTPGAPSSASAATTGTNEITVDWTPTAYESGAVFHRVQRSVNGGAYATVVSGLAWNATSWIDTSPGAGSNQYRVQAYYGALASGWTTTNVVSTIVPPLAPSNLSPNGTTVDLNGNQTFSWRHNHGGDGAPQSAFEIRFSDDGGSTWTAHTASGGASQSYVLPGGTLTNGDVYTWQVRTQGQASAGFGPWSGSGTVSGSAKPVVTLTVDDPMVTLPVSASWVFNQDQGEPQTQWTASLLDAAGTTLQSLSGSGTTSSVTFTHPVQDGQTYWVRVQARSSSGLWSDVAEKTTTINLLPPAQPHIDAFYDACTGAVALEISADDPVPVPVVARTNLVPNPSPVAGGSVWGYPAAVSSISFMEEGGEDFLRLEVTEEPPGTTPYAISPVSPASAGIPYSGKILIRTSSDSVGRIQPRLRFSGASGVIQDFTLATSEVQGEWYAAEWAGAVAPAGTTNVRIIGTATATRAAGDLHDFKRALIEQRADPVGDYFDGDTPPSGNREYRWTGTPGESASEEVIPATDNVDYVDVQRRIDGGDWRTIATDVFVNNQLPEITAEGFEDGDGGWVPNSEFGSYGPDPVVVSTDVAGPPLPLPEGTHYLDIEYVAPAGGTYGQNVVAPIGGLSPGQTYTAVMSVYNPTGTGVAAKVSFISPPTGGVPIPADNSGWQTVAISWTATGETHHVGIVNTAPVAGQHVYVDKVVVYEGTASDYNGVVPMPTTIIDPIPQTVGLNEYRVIAHSSSGSTSISAIAEADGTNDTPGTFWAFLAYGPSFSNILRAGCDLEISASTSRTRAAASLLRPGLPLGLVGAQTGRIVDVSAVLSYPTRHDCTEPDRCTHDSPRDEWEEASWESTIVCYRDHTGRRIFGVLGPDVVTADIYPGMANLSFSVIQTSYDEPTWTV